MPRTMVKTIRFLHLCNAKDTITLRRQKEILSRCHAAIENYLWAGAYSPAFSIPPTFLHPLQILPKFIIQILSQVI